jgi:hypothetical protein
MSPTTRHLSLFTRHLSLVTRHLSLVFISAFLLASCDVIEAPFFEQTDIDTSVTANPQKVLLMDFTGHTCKSCPKAHKSIEQMSALYGDRLIPIAFHLGYFAKPLTTGKFTTDFRTEEGALLEKYFEFVSFPIGTVQTLDKNQLQPYASWPGLVSANITGDAPVKIEIIPEYLAGLNAMTPEVKITAVAPVTGSVNLAVYLIEDGIVDWQKDEDFDPMDIPDYVHNHVFRTSFNGLWGEPVGAATGIEKGFTKTVELSKVLAQGWRAENCRIIAFVYRNDTKEIIQAESVAAN